MNFMNDNLYYFIHNNNLNNVPEEIMGYSSNKTLLSISAIGNITREGGD
jgi:hypothetical protein